MIHPQPNFKSLEFKGVVYAVDPDYWKSRRRRLRALRTGQYVLLEGFSKDGTRIEFVRDPDAPPMRMRIIENVHLEETNNDGD